MAAGLQEAAYPLHMFAVIGYLHSEKTSERILCGALTHIKCSNQQLVL